jgi:hypothetical protein
LLTWYLQSTLLTAERAKAQGNRALKERFEVTRQGQAGRHVRHGDPLLPLLQNQAGRLFHPCFFGRLRIDYAKGVRRRIPNFRIGIPQRLDQRGNRLLGRGPDL